MDIRKWLDYVEKVGVIVDDSPTECDICETESRKDLWMREDLLTSLGDEVKPHVCQKHGREYEIVW